jgi:hypothetical protein
MYYHLQWYRLVGLIRVEATYGCTNACCVQRLVPGACFFVLTFGAFMVLGLCLYGFLFVYVVLINITFCTDTSQNVQSRNFVCEASGVFFVSCLRVPESRSVDIS